MDNLKRYRLGLLVLMLLVLGLTGYVVVQSSNVRKDTATEKRAREIAEDLNSYTIRKGKVPESLSAARITDVPSTISYEKKSSSSYEFCATYRQPSDRLSSANLGQAVAGAALGAGAYGPAYDYGDDSILVIGQHTKGRNCQTVSIMGRYDSYDGSGFDSYDTSPYTSPSTPSAGSQCKYDYAKTDSQNDAYYTCLNEAYNTRFQ